MEPSIACAHAGSDHRRMGDHPPCRLRRVPSPYGYRQRGFLGPPLCSPSCGGELKTLARRLGRRPKILVGKPGLDGHSNGAEQIAVRARDAGFEVVYEGIRLTPARIANAALEEGVHLIGLSVLSGSHLPLVSEVLRQMREAGIGGIPVVVGGIIPEEDRHVLRQLGVKRVFTPKDYRLNDLMSELAGLVAETASIRPSRSASPACGPRADRRRGSARRCGAGWSAARRRPAEIWPRRTRPPTMNDPPMTQARIPPGRMSR